MDIFRNLHPLSTTIYFLSVTMIAMFIQNPVIYALALLGGIVMRLWVTGGSFNWWIVVIAPIGIAVTNPIVSRLGKTELFRVLGAKITLESVLFGLSAGIMLAAVVIWFSCLGYVMGSDKTVYLLGKGLPKVALTLTVALRFIPLMMRNMNKISRTQRVMGMYCCNSRIERIKSAGNTLVTLIASSAENAMDTASAMNARGYGLKGRTSLIKYKFRFKDFALILVCALLVAVVISTTASNGLEFEFYPIIVGAKADLINLCAYLSYGLLILVAPLMKVVEEARWKYCVSKI